MSNGNRIAQSAQPLGSTVIDAAAIGSAVFKPAHAEHVLVIGAGPAGVSAALRLHALGRRVLLVDRAEFPRSKVCGCCLNLAAISALATIGCERLVTQMAPATLTTWRLSTSGRVVEASLPGGIALSRSRMDAALVAEAQRRGVQLRTGCDAKITEVRDSHVEVQLSGDVSSRRFDAVILASGLSGGGVSRWLPWISQPAGPLGVGLVVDEVAGVEDRTIHIACDGSGYVGLVRLEDGRIDVAAALRRGVEENCHSTFTSRRTIASHAKASLITAIDRILAGAKLGSLPALDPQSLMTTPPLHRARLPGRGRLLAVGDAASYIEPFTGEGMAWAIQTGIAAAECLADPAASVDYGKAWTRRHAHMMRRRQWLCRMLSHTLTSPTRSRWMLRVMTAAPWTVRYAVRRLNRVG